MAGMSTPSPKERARIAVEADVSARTVQRIYEGEDSYITTFRRVEAAAKRLKLPLPQEPAL